MSYKPPDWKNPHCGVGVKGETEEQVDLRCAEALAYEAGADKMFEELSKLPLEELMKIFSEHTDRYEEL